MVHKHGVWRIVEATVAKCAVTDGNTFKPLLLRLAVGLRTFAKEEGKRVKATVTHLVDEVAELRQEMMRDPSCKATSTQLAVKEAQLREYQASRKDKQHQMSASDFFADIFKRDQCQVEEDWCPAQGRKLRFWEAEELAADSTEEEVKKAFSAMAANKSLGKDGLPKELSEAHWDLLGKGFMALAKDFTSLAVLLTEAKEVVTILLHNKGDKDQLNNYRPITLLNFTYKVLARVVTNTMKKNMTWVISPEQYGFLPGRQLSDAVGLVADNIDTTRNDYEDWFLLVVDFKKTFDSVSRGYLFRTLRAMGFPDRLVCWVEGLHAETQTWVLVNGWIGGWHGGGLRGPARLPPCPVRVSVCG
ncbi:unnamed protein product [Closterium sp. NIES-53]